MLFTDRSIWTMVHGIGLGGAALLGLAAALFHVYAARASPEPYLGSRDASRSFAGLTVFTAAMLWLTVLLGTYVIFPLYRAAPPAGVTDLSQYPRALIHANPGTVWLHAFAMESKEHVPWIASMLATAVAFVAVRYRSQALRDPSLRTTLTVMLAICFALVSWMSRLGVFVNKVAPLQ
jgi:hypothetical protein